MLRRPGGFLALLGAAALLWMIARWRRSFTTKALKLDDAAQQLSALTQLWTGSVECVLGVPGAVDASGLFLAPQAALEARPESKPTLHTLPPILRTGKPMFALTAFDPPGVTRTLAENTAENSKLLRELQTMNVPAAQIWPSFGFDVTEGWREDGFFLMFDAMHTQTTAQSQVLAVARKFQQGAIFAYLPSDTDPTALLRLTVPCDDAHVTKVLVHYISRPRLEDKHEDLIERPWAGPPELRP